MGASREMTLDEYVGQLPASHAAAKEYRALRDAVAGGGHGPACMYVVESKPPADESWGEIGRTIDEYTRRKAASPPSELTGEDADGYLATAERMLLACDENDAKGAPLSIPARIALVSYRDLAHSLKIALSRCAELDERAALRRENEELRGALARELA